MTYLRLSALSFQNSYDVARVTTTFAAVDTAHIYGAYQGNPSHPVDQRSRCYVSPGEILLQEYLFSSAS